MPEHSQLGFGTSGSNVTVNTSLKAVLRYYGFWDEIMVKCLRVRWIRTESVMWCKSIAENEFLALFVSNFTQIYEESLLYDDKI